jgi:hypothetical protein
LIPFGVTAGAVFLIGAGIWFRFGPTRAEPNPPASAPTQSDREKQVSSSRPERSLPIVEKSPRKDEPVSSPAIDSEGTKAERRDLGRFFSKLQPSPVLLQRQGELYPWVRVRPGDRIYSSDYLLSLPGYRSVLYLDSGVRLELWGNLPEFSSFPPVLESVVVLQKPSSPLDLEFFLDRGRVRLFNGKPMGEAQVRVHFQQVSWDLALPDARSEVVLELWDSTLGQGASGTVARPRLDLLAKGRARVKSGEQQYSLGNLGHLSWSPGGSVLSPDVVSKLPEWWIADETPPKWPKDLPPELVNRAVAALALKDFSSRLENKESVLDEVLTQVRGSDQDSVRALGTLFLGAMDAVPHLLSALGDPRHREVRGTAAHALRCWLSRNPGQDRELVRILVQEKGTAREKAQVILRWLRPLSDADAARPETYQELLGSLEHDNLEVRELAAWHLENLFPEDAARIRFDPGEEDLIKRKQKVAEWRKVIPPGTLPAKPGLLPDDRKRSARKS